MLSLVTNLASIYITSWRLTEEDIQCQSQAYTSICTHPTSTSMPVHVYAHTNVQLTCANIHKYIDTAHTYTHFKNMKWVINYGIFIKGIVIDKQNLSASDPVLTAWLHLKNLNVAASQNSV